MAELVMAIGSSHGPTIQSPPEDWLRLGEGDTRDPRFNYQELLRNAKPNLEEELTLETRTQRHEANQAGLAKLAEFYKQADLDAVVVVSNPHRIHGDDNQPVFGVFRGATLPVAVRTSDRFDPDARFREGGRAPREIKEMPGQPELANHLIRALIEEGFDVACTDKLREGSGLDEAFTFLYERFDQEGGVPMVPFMLSRYLPYQATAKRCVALGKALRRAVEGWDPSTSSGRAPRVGLLASGGLSHQVIDEELDRMVIDALVERDEQRLCSLSTERLNRAPGTPEILNWVTVASAMAPVGMSLVGYQPCYRSVAGTGHGVTFGTWG